MLDEDAKEEVVGELWRFTNSVIKCSEDCRTALSRHGWKGEPMLDFLNEHFPNSYVEQVLSSPLYSFINGNWI